MSHPPQTPVKVPGSAANYTPATQDPDLRSQINMLLIREGHMAKYVTPYLSSFTYPPHPILCQLQQRNPPTNNPSLRRIQDHFLHSLNAHPANWPSAVQAHALTLLRSGDVTTFPALVRRVIEDIRHDTAAADSSTTNGTNGSEANGASTNGNANGASKTGVNGTSNTDNNLAIPQAVVESVIKVTRECLEAVCEIDDGATADVKEDEMFDDGDVSPNGTKIPASQQQAGNDCIHKRVHAMGHSSTDKYPPKTYSHFV
ncbi:uncharacterized protein F4822DRAFT_424352 [Hypoxylon trugodes]|uniref:uncharacterized protein n=1 Tax=Hypoxylon trugodes TaxID=326681 RepID=UPI00219A28F4|nr:uncharacterized protein F4822DRAFT_424352 [Hypoxylon trugodes]KAI1393887.1 hypothetical protein F4822DRAFT_424352 [Hypoxylon trugodes]